MIFGFCVDGVFGDWCVFWFGRVGCVVGGFVCVDDVVLLCGGNYGCYFFVFGGVEIVVVVG